MHDPFWERPNNLISATAVDLLLPVSLPAQCSHTGCDGRNCTYQKYRTPTQAELSIPGVKPYVAVHCRLTFQSVFQSPFVIASEAGLTHDGWFQFMGEKVMVMTYAPHSMADKWPKPSEVYGLSEALVVIPWGKLL